MRLWALLRNKRFAGLKFRRQHPFGPYILDFYCPSLRLAVELDGAQHASPTALEYDLERLRTLQRASIRELRFTNRQVLLELEGVLEILWRAVQAGPDIRAAPTGRGSPIG